MTRAARRRREPAARRLAVPVTATLTGLTLAASVAVPAALAPERPADRSTARPAPERTVRGAAAGALRAARTDQIRARQWHLNDMHVTRAWRWSRGAGVTVAVLDTGVDRRHPDLAGRVTTGPDLTGGTRRPGGKYWGLHGTSMASIIAGHGHGPGQQEGVLGLAPQAQILSVRVTWENDDPMRRNGGEVGRNRDAVAQGIRYAVDNGAHVINMSLGGGRQFYNGSQAEESAIRYALSRGVVLIASAGNDGSAANRKNFPAAYPGVIAVGALDRRLRLWKDSNRHPYVTVCAPGVDIVSADAGTGYVVGTGTSPSSAIVAGVAALIRSRYPKLTPEQIRQALVQGSPPRRQPTGSETCRGPLDAARALQAAARLSKARTLSGAAPAPADSRPMSAPEEDEEPDTLLFAILAGGGVLVLLGLVLGWRQRRRPGDEDDFAYEPPREPAGAVAPSGPVAEPPVWQSRDVSLSGTSADLSIPHGTPADKPVWPPNGDRPERDRHEPAESPPYVAPGHRPAYADPPYRPGEAAYGPADAAPVPYDPAETAADRAYGDPASTAYDADPPYGPAYTAGGRERADDPSVTPDIHDPLGVGDPPEVPGVGSPLYGEGPRPGRDPWSTGAPDPFDGGGPPAPSGGPVPDADTTATDGYPTFDDDEWDRFRRSALAEPGADTDGLPGGAFPPAPPPGLADRPSTVDPLDEDPLRRGRRSRPADEDDYRPPWW
ncbi:S8 family serine peptidase [Actinomadura kijaniata]|uniref:S8 family serine peptidase n=1 Tax=Actinomadura kijaniata TaxID=46161 RepID=UPI000AC3B5B0|nr:S8 family serine peptidase [Actinomadura kijaniata]